MSDKISIAVMDNPIVRDLIQSGELAIDFFEVHGPNVESAMLLIKNKPFLVHNSVYDVSLGCKNMLQKNGFAEKTVDVLQKTQSPWLSLHLGFSASEVMFYKDGVYPISEVLDCSYLFDVFCQNLFDIQQFFQLPILIENMDYSRTGAYEFICDPEFVSSVILETGISMLLDIAHAKISSSKFSMSPLDYISELPLHKISQLHCNSPRLVAGTQLDLHDPLNNEDMILLQEVLKIVSPDVITLEYRSDKATILEHLGLIHKLLDQTDTK